MQGCGTEDFKNRCIGFSLTSIQERY